MSKKYLKLNDLIKQRLRLNYGMEIGDPAIEAIIEEVIDWLRQSVNTKDD